MGKCFCNILFGYLQISYVPVFQPIITFARTSICFVLFVNFNLVFADSDDSLYPRR